ncbi:hypothetical protein Vsou_22770 [Vulcanisaeta souniana JCM 11219]|uniref:Uncharacterized protein n=1 Tax=Vulcanisaeta souniana JCM 11219 TaxID=1293586 RepID=A0ABM8BQ64_9CREN|nr:hypothetical protein Vsou_22770 [Vulcanisaeta souniana JCM 11219]
MKKGGMYGLMTRDLNAEIALRPPPQVIMIVVIDHEI